MAHRKKHTEEFSVRLTKEWAERVVAVADHERIQESNSQVIRDCIATALPQFELSLGIVEPEPAPVAPVSAGWGPDRG